MTTRTQRRRFLRREVVIPVLVVAAVMFALALYWFQPWKLVVDETVDEAVPTAEAAPAAGGAETPNTEPVVLAQGELISHEHPTSGTVTLLRLSDGQRVLRFENLETSNGPLLRVYLTDQPVIDGSDGWHVFDDGRYENLGDLKGNQGNQNYFVPAGADITGLNSVSIWCDRFDVSFGAATLAPVTVG